MFYHERPIVVGVLCNLTVWILEHLNITSWENIDQRWIYFEQALRVSDLKKFINDALSFRDTAKADLGDHFNLGKTKDVKPEYLWAFYKADRLDEDGDELTGKERFIYLYQDLWFHVGRSMWNMHQNMFNKHTGHVNNDIPKPFKMGILQYAEHVHKIFELAKYLTTPSRNN